MNEDLQLLILSTQIAKLESKISDTRYFIETALCLETKLIYQGTLAELIDELNKILQLRDQLTKNK